MKILKGKHPLLDSNIFIGRNVPDSHLERMYLSSVVLYELIGRLRKPPNKPFLFQILEDDDPKVVCQAIRGLLVYNDDDSVKRRLKPLMDHPNEIVRNVIHKEYFAEKRSLTNYFASFTRHTRRANSHVALARG